MVPQGLEATGRPTKRARTGGIEQGEGSAKGSSTQESELERDGELWCEQFFAEEDAEHMGEEAGLSVFGVSPQA